MAEPATSPKPSSVGAFMRGLFSGSFNGAIMLGIYWLVVKGLIVAGATGLTALTAGPMIATVITTGLFGGIMAVKRAMSGHEHEHNAERTARTAVMIPTISQGVSISPEIAQSAEPEADRGSWAERTGRSEGTQSRVQQILANGSLSDKDRATAILAERERSAGNSASIH